MRITSITIRHYRVHRELTVALDPARTVIGGPNESGKSTLLEAAHRAFFLRAKRTGEMQRAMVSQFGGGHPEVVVEFECGGRAFRIEKRFSGQSGRATLTEIGGTVWHDEEAESQLAKLLGAEPPGGSQVAQMWGHLWIQQGTSGSDPTGHANEHRDVLLARLGGGGGAAMQSECDARVATSVASRREAIYNKNGSVKVGSDLGRATQVETETAAALVNAQSDVGRLRHAADDFQDAERTMREADTALAKLRVESEATDAERERLAELERIEQEQRHQAQTVGAKHAVLVAAEARIAALRADVRRKTEDLAPKEARIQQLDEHAAECGARSAEAAEAHRVAGEKARAARLVADLATAHVTQLEAAALEARLRERRDAAREVGRAMAEHEAQLLRMPAVTPAKMKTLQKLDGECASASAALEAMAAAVEVIAMDQPVKLGEKTLAVGEREILTDAAEIAVGPKVRLRITPGGGTSLAEARSELMAASAKLQRELDALAIASVSVAVEIQAERQRIEQEIKAGRARLAGLDGEKIEDEWAAANDACVAARAEVERRTVAVETFSAPENAADARALAAKLLREREGAEREETAAAKARDAAAKAAAGAAAEAASQRQALHDEQAALSRAAAELRVLEGEHGEDAVRARQLAGSHAAKAAADAALTGTREEMAKLQPDAIEQNRKRQARALEQLNAGRHAAETRRAVALSALQRDGSSDPYTALAEAEAAAHSAAERRAIVQRQAEAIALLDTLFVEEQRALTEHFTRPLAERITRYVRCIFGPEARAVVTMEENALAGLGLARDGTGAFAFDTLSGGAREQVAAAVRLAMAELLSEAHDGCLPVIFDDAFAYSDPERVQTLQRMLDLAAESGLQVIVLTCNPADYAALGAKQITLRPEPSSAGVPSVG